MMTTLTYLDQDRCRPKDNLDASNLNHPSPTGQIPSDGVPQPAPFDVQALRGDFPVLQSQARGLSLIYLDNAATSQMPKSVFQAIEHYEQGYRANIHRGVHALSEKATVAYEAARRKVQTYLGAADPSEIIFTRGTTESLNLVAQSFARPRLKPGEVILLTLMEHHSNIVPWQQVAQATGARIVWLGLRPDGQLDLESYARILKTEPVKIVAVTHISHVLGLVNPIKTMTDLAHEQGAVIVVDGAQAAVHGPQDLKNLSVDFYAFSGHKALGPTGIGVLYGLKKWLYHMPPYQTGGGMVEQVSQEGTQFQPPPTRFEAGTAPIAGAIGLGKALDILTDLHQIPGLKGYQEKLTQYTWETLKTVTGLSMSIPAQPQVGIVSFELKGVHPHDLASWIDSQYGVAVRAGHHCAQPLLKALGQASSTRASPLFYNTVEEIDRLVQALWKAKKFFSG